MNKWRSVAADIADLRPRAPCPGTQVSSSGNNKQTSALETTTINNHDELPDSERPEHTDYG